MENQVKPYSLFSDFDNNLFKAGKHFKLYEKLGSHLIKVDEIEGTYFAVWAPNAKEVSVIGSFNGWNDHSHHLYPNMSGTGVWEGFVPHVKKGDIYKYKIHSHHYGQVLDKFDPFALLMEVPPKTASVVWDITDYHWQDKKWLDVRAKHNALDAPYSVYEVHLGSWKRKYNEGGRSLSYVEMADELVQYVKEMEFTHVELMPIMEHPFFGSWGYQVTGFFAPSSRFGTPQELMFLIDKMHENGIGVILDWVPSHFPTDSYALANYDGTALYEHEDPRKGFHPDWGSFIFNYGRNEVRAFLISNALFWLDKYHADGLRVDAVASMLYLDYSRKQGEWIPNIYGGNENLEAVSFLKEMNEAVYLNFPDVQTIAEESTAFAGISKPVFLGGLGFGMKWMMGWMNDTLKYFKEDPMFRSYHHGTITFSLVYAFTENFMMPLSHDEVVHGKGPLLDKMPGDTWQKFANLRLLFGYMFTHPGNKLLFMGSEIGQSSEWKHDYSVEWHLTEYPLHSGVQHLVKDLNHIFKTEKALHQIPFSNDGFEWIDLSDDRNSILIYMRKGKEEDDKIIAICNFTPMVQENYRFGVPDDTATLVEVLNTDGAKYGGSGVVFNPRIEIENISSHHRTKSVSLRIPALSVLILKPTFEKKSTPKEIKKIATKATKEEKPAPAKVEKAKTTTKAKADTKSKK